MKGKNMTMYLIIQETTFKNVDSIFNVINFTSDIDKANDMLQGYNLINKDNNVFYTLVKYEAPIQKEREAHD
jgi:hypothetical protein|tara:strand:- start:145 stop:360 length:216 start_codon:yes stop_codon:yes gene_type:complete